MYRPSRSSAAAALLLLAFAPSARAATAAANSVVSASVAPADGKTGQTLTSGTGVKTGHLQDGAVTASKIAAGAVTDAKISGTISASKIATTGLNADTVDGKHAADLAPAVHTHAQADVTGLAAALAAKAEASTVTAALATKADASTVNAALATKADAAAVDAALAGKQSKYANVLVVAKSGGDFTDPAAAVAAAGASASPANRYLVKVMPGVYDLGDAMLWLRSYVDLEGSGEGITVLTGGGPNSGFSGMALVRLEADTAIRALTVENKGGGEQSNGLVLYGSAKVSHVTVSASGGVWHSLGIIVNMGSALIEDVKVTVTGNGDPNDPKGQSNWGIYLVSGARSVVQRTEVTSTAARYSYGIGVGLWNGYGTTTVELVDARVTARNAGGYGNACYGLQNGQFGVVLARNSTFDAEAAVLNQGTFTAHGSILKGSAQSLYAASPGVTSAATSQLDGPVFTEGPAIKCFQTYDAALAPVTCP